MVSTARAGCRREQPPTLGNICAVVVTYHPDLDLSRRIESVSKQVSKVIIVDNNSSLSDLSMLQKISSDFGVHLILNKENLGVATALNQGVHYALNSEQDCSWFLMLDQDTLLFPDMVQNLIDAYNSCPFRDQVGIVGSNYQEWTTDRILFQKSQRDSEAWAEVKDLPTSGCLTSIPVFKDVGDFRDSFFIDYVDTEYCIRLRERGYKVIISPKVGMKHPLGYYRHSELHDFLFGRPMITNYPPMRHYYWTRNGLVLICENLRSSTRWALNEAYYLLIRRPITVLLFEDCKLLKMKYIIMAIFDACLFRRNGARSLR